MNIKSEVENIITKRWEGLKDPKELISLYSIEKQTNQGYNGRQLLELFQNCEDEGASKVRIFLNTENCLLEISNDGNKPFSIKGYDSIFYPGLSSKVSSGYIGNKGLGFRSIINWADEISIISNNFKVVFNSEFKRDILLKEIGYTESELIIIRKERKLNSEIYPIPFLNSCKILDLDAPHEYATTISINYKKEFEQDIINQLNSISSKTLLFLHNINTIEIEGDTINNIISVTRTNLGNNNFEINYDGEIYYVLSDEGIVDEDLVEDKESSEPKRFSVKIAYNDDLSFRDKVLYNYFKTQIPFELPFVVHASLELDQNRNHSTESKVNPFILDKLFQLHLRFIEKLKNKFNKSWLPYQTIDNDTFSVYKPYSDLIDNYWGDFKVYPTLSGNYYTNDEAKNLGNRFAEFLESNHLEKYYEEQIAYCDLAINPQQYISKPENYIEIIEAIAKDLDFQQRAKFIKLILEDYPNVKFCVLIDENNKLITINDFVYTDKTANNKGIEVPSYSKISFLHSSLFLSLIGELGLQSDTEKSRSLTDKLQKISNIHSFEPQTVIKKIISETSDHLNENNLNSNEIIIEFYQTLFHNYKLREENPKLDYDSKIPCLNQLNKIEDIRDLVLSKEFEIGKLSQKIFGELYERDCIITNLKNLGLENEDIKEVINFLKWLGINHFSIVERKTSNINSKYINFINSANNTSISNYDLYTIKYFDKIFTKETININQLIAWLSLDGKLKIVFNDFTSTHSSNEKLTYHYYGTKYLYSFVNFIYYSIFQNFEINKFLISSKKNEWFNPFKIDYDYLREINEKLDKNEVDRILLFFGAKKDFNDLDIGYLKEKTQELADRKNHKGAQVFYKNLVGHFREKQKQILKVDLFAKKGENIVVKNSTDIYFSDRIQLPESLTQKFPILYYPSRSGGAKAIEMFGLKNLNDLDLKIIKVELNNSISHEFEIFIKEIKPFILAFRLDKITKEDVKKGQVQLINKLKINCCDELTCSIDDEEFEIEPYNYIVNNDQFYFNIPDISTLSSLKQNKQFIDNLSDVFLKVFDTLDEKKIYESIIKQSKEDNIYDINNELAEGILEEAKILLGEISIRLSIWKSIFKIKELEGIADLNDNNLEEYINHFFPAIVKTELFDSDENLDEITRIRNVFNNLSINLEGYNNISDYKLTFDKVFQKELKDFYDERKKILKNQLWHHYKDKNFEEQGNFLKYLHKIEHLLKEITIDKNLSTYNFNNIILNELGKVFPSINFEIDNDDYQDYDEIEQINIEQFSTDELLTIRKDEILNSLSYFENLIDFIKSEITNKEEKITEKENIDFNLDKNQLPRLIEDFTIELSSGIFTGGPSGNLWLGETNELSTNQKKKLGTSVEVIVKKYLDNNPHLYERVEHISKTSEGEHYDIKYYDLKDKNIKYVECKYYNGISFFLSREEKHFFDNHPKQYEIWLVNKDSKIFCIKDIKKLGELQPVNYKVNIKLKDYAITN
ncbi:MAG: DUF3883 domain-containing protein [Bacteroidota bacterium]|nr:DUF3883 domain-containing protein [Bacteroidota bacterium]